MRRTRCAGMLVARQASGGGAARRGTAVSIPADILSRALSCAAQVARMLASRAVLVLGAEHPHELADDIALIELRHRRERRVDGGVLRDREVTLGERGDLREVGDAHDLPTTCEALQTLPHGAGGVPADAGVDLVEDERGLRRGACRPGA